MNSFEEEKPIIEKKAFRSTMAPDKVRLSGTIKEIVYKKDLN